MSLVKYGKMAVKKYPAVRKRYRVYAPAIKQLASDVAYVKGLVNSEAKYLTVQSSNNVDYNGVMVSLSSIPQGSTNITRVGNSVLPRYFNVKMSIGTSSTFSSHKIVARVIFFRSWVEQSTTTGSLTPSEVLVASNVGTAYAPLSHYVQSNIGPRGDRDRRLEILRNFLITFDDIGHASETITFDYEMNKGTSRKKEHIQYTSSATAEATSGGIYMLIITDNATATQFQYQLESRLVFYDN